LEVEKELTEENVTLEKLEGFVELVTSYKCRICPFTTPDQQELLQHFRFHHMQVRILGTELQFGCGFVSILVVSSWNIYTVQQNEQQLCFLRRDGL
jgi:hypothetical protein